MTELRTEFVDECREYLVAASEALLQFEEDADRAALHEVFRSVHTIKGAAGLFEIPALTTVTHAAEDLLNTVREGEQDLHPALADALLAALDQVGAWVDHFEQHPTLPDDATDRAEALAVHIRSLAAAPPPQADASAPTPRSAPPGWLEAVSPDDRQRLATSLRHRPGRTLFAVTYTPDAHCFFSGGDPMLVVADVPGREWLRAEPRTPWPSLVDLDPFICVLDFQLLAFTTAEALEDVFLYAEDEVSWTPVALHDLVEPDDEPPTEQVQVVQPEPAPPPVAEPTPSTDPPEPPTERRGSHRSLKVEVERIDALMDLTGELTVAKNALPFLARKAAAHTDGQALSREILEQHARIHRLCEEFQAAVMRLRMMAVGTVFSRLPRLVRDLSRKQGKPVRLELSGEETEADKTVVESLGEALVHLVRNAIDHGIEPLAERRAAGKPEEGTLRLSATSTSDEVCITLADDGRGIDQDAVVARAIERGVLSAADAPGLSRQEALHLIFSPGLSTAAAVTDVSGRGVGMDAVRAMVHRNRGTITVDSDPGVGTTITFRLPLSMAVSHILVVDSDGQPFGLPMEAVRETLKVARTDIQTIRGEAVLTLREQTMPLLYLRSLLDQPARPDATHDYVVVLHIHGSPIALAVDRLFEGMDVVVKPLAGVMEGLSAYRGTTMLGDGQVLLILDIAELIRCR